MDLRWKGTGVDEEALNDKPIVKVSPKYFRPTEVETLLGDASKAKSELGWLPKISFQDLVSEMERGLSSLKASDER